ncbi:hypothetical protein MMF96_05850 [Arthrobacter sp. STN4]|nr:hypothetical protein [Arthrobacter sp. STN4]
MTTSYTYDKTNHPTSLTTPAGTWSFSYNSNGRLASEKFPSGHTTTYGRSPTGAIWLITYSDGTNASQASYSFDANGNRTRSQLDGAAATIYQYNALTRLWAQPRATAKASSHGHTHATTAATKPAPPSRGQPPRRWRMTLTGG